MIAIIAGSRFPRHNGQGIEDIVIVSDVSSLLFDLFPQNELTD